MGRELTKRYSALFEKKGAKNLFSFVDDLYRNGKLTELTSFVVWEICHKLGLFPQNDYVRFDNNNAIELEKVRLCQPDFSERLHDFFASKGLTATPSPHNWKAVFIGELGEVIGTLYPNDRDLYRSVDNGDSITLMARFPEPIKSLFVSSENTVFVCTKGAVYRSNDASGSFERSLELSTSQSFFRHNNAMTETPEKTLIIAEYGNVWEEGRWRKLAYLYFSFDGGKSWERSDFLLKAGANKHVHLVRYSRLLDRILVADGDNKKKLWISDPLSSSDSRELRWKPVNRFHIQMGGYTSIAETDEKILFGTDYQGGTNFIVETTDGATFKKSVVPDPYRRSPIDNMLQRKSRQGCEIWANLPFSTAGTRCLLMYTANGGESWNKVIDYSRATHKVWLLSSSREPAEELYFSIENTKSKKRLVYKVVDGDA